ncbi:MAG: branched-chain amino acid transporter permease, partial [Herminiimonas sp.]|nr:branched-chain amino acid transporter permease [Herminiimonas sp.]
PIVGAVVIIALENKLGDWGNWLAALTNIEWFKSIGEAVTMVTGLIFIICVLAFRRGIVGEIMALFKRSPKGDKAKA